MVDDLREDLRRIADLTYENSRAWAVHVAQCDGRYQDLRRDIGDLRRILRYVLLGLLIIGTVMLGKASWPSLEAMLPLLIH